LNPERNDQQAVHPTIQSQARLEDPQGQQLAIAWETAKLAEQRGLPGLIVGSYRTISADGRQRNESVQSPKDRDLWLDLMRTNLGITSANLWRRDTVVEAGGFDWAKAGKFPEITAPDPSYHGLNFWEALCSLEGTPCTAFWACGRSSNCRMTG
jgi:hypothetical protein